MKLLESQWRLLSLLAERPVGAELRREQDMRPESWAAVKDLESRGLIRLSRAVCGPLRVWHGTMWATLTEAGVEASIELKEG